MYRETVLGMLEIVYPDAVDDEISVLCDRAMEYVPHCCLDYEDIHHSHWSIAATMIWLSSLAYSRMYPGHRRTQKHISLAVGGVSTRTMQLCRNTMGFENLVIHS